MSIAMASDNNNKIQLLVLVYSILKNRDSSNQLDFHILITDDFDKDIIIALKSLFSWYGTTCYEFLNMGNKYCNQIIYTEHLKTPAFYRLSLPDLLQADKCIYLDTDIIVLKDLYDLFNQISEKDLVSGVKAAGFYWPLDSLETRAKYLKVDKFDKYINSGVLVMNLNLMRKQNSVQKFNDLLSYNFKNEDQDILNSACYDYIKIIPPKYNSMTKYWNDNFNNYYSDCFPYLKYCYSESEWKEACEDPVIIHYADKEKPWNTIGVAHFRLWWQYLKEVDKFYPCYDELYNRFIDEQINKARNDNALLKDSILELEQIKNSRPYKLAQIIAKFAKPFKSH